MTALVAYVIDDPFNILGCDYCLFAIWKCVEAVDAKQPRARVPSN